MVSKRTFCLMLAAAALGGLLAGAAFDRVIVQDAAWKRLGATAWSGYARQADLGAGLLWYPAQGLGALVLSIAAAVSVRKDRGAPSAAVWAALIAALLAITALILTASVIVPNTRAARDLASHAHAFGELTTWWPLKAMLHLATFGANLWALVTAMGRDCRAQ